MRWAMFIKTHSQNHAAVGDEADKQVTWFANYVEEVKEKLAK